MSDLAKLASLSKRLKTGNAKTHEDRSALSGKITSTVAKDIAPPPSGNGDHAEPARPISAPAIAPTMAGGPAPNVSVNVDLSPVTEMLSRIRDEMRNLREEIAKTRKDGMKVDLGGDAAEQMDQALKHLSAVSKASRELTEKLVTSLPESRWYSDFINLQREVGAGMAAGGGKGGGNPEEMAAIKEQLEMQKTQLTAILSILQRR
jgi:hypothetical protein